MLECLVVSIVFFVIVSAVGLWSLVTRTPPTAKPAATESSVAKPVPLPAPAPSPAPAPTPDGPQLVLVSWAWHAEGGQITGEGEVKNVSAGILQNVEAVTSYYTADDKFITSNEAIIEYNPILPGQTSPYKTTGTFNPAIQSGRIDFKTFMGGQVSWKKQ
jgi:hypothetical protein